MEERTIKLPKTELNTEAAMAACELWAGSVEEESGVLPCPSSFLSSTALVRITADDTGGGMHDTTVSLSWEERGREGGWNRGREGGGREEGRREGGRREGG